MYSKSTHFAVKFCSKSSHWNHKLCGSCSFEIYGKCMGTKKSFKFDLHEMNTQVEHLFIRMVLHEDFSP